MTAEGSVSPALRNDLRVCLLSDGVAGHTHQALGVVEALRSIRPVHCRVVQARLRLGLLRTPLRWRLNRRPAPDTGTLLDLAYAFAPRPQPDCDLIVSAGGKTAFANAWLAAMWGVDNIFAGSLRGLDGELFSAVLTLEALPGVRSNLVVELPPGRITPASAAAAGAALRERLSLGGERLWTLLLGGDGAGYRYRRNDWLQIAAVVNALGHQQRVRWLVASSRRSGRRGEGVLRAALDPAVVARAFWAGAGEQAAVEALLGAGERAFVGEDSMTMLGEAMSAGRPVYSLRPACARSNARYAQALQAFQRRGWLVRHELRALAADPSLSESRLAQPLDHDPLTTLGKRLADHLNW